MAIYYVYSGAGGSNNGSNWTNAFTTLTTAFVTEAAGDTLYVAHDHAETTAGAVTLTSSGTIANPTKIICVNRAGSVPPVSADRRATAQVTTTGATILAFDGHAHYDGIIFTAGNLISLFQNQSRWHRFDNCSLRLGALSTGMINCGGMSGTYAELNNTTMSFGHINQRIEVASIFRWRNTPSALIGSAVPTSLFIPATAFGADVECIGVDLSALGVGKTICSVNTNNEAYRYRFIDCKLDAAVTKSGVPAFYGTFIVDFVRSGAAGVNYAVHSQRISGLLTEETTIVHIGGASDGTTPIAWKVITTANCTYSMPFEAPPIAIWCDTTGSAVTATVEGIAATLPTDQEIWLDVEYLGSGSSPQGSFVNDGKANLLAVAANQTSSSETWGGSTAAFKLEVTFTPQQKGWIYARVKCAKASSTFYVDPMVTLS